MKIKIFLVMSLLLSGVNIHYSSAQTTVWNPDNGNFYESYHVGRLARSGSDPG